MTVNESSKRRMSVLTALLFILVVMSAGCTDDDKKPEVETGGWNNLSNIQKDIKDSLPYKFRLLSNTSNAVNIQNPSESILFLIGLETAITPEERVSLIDYVKSGGTLVFASDREDLAEPFTKYFRIRYYHHRLVDTSYTYNWEFINLKCDFFGTEMDLLFNGPRGLNITDSGEGMNDTHAGPVDPDDEPVEDENIVQVLASSPVLVKEKSIVGYSFIDINDNENQDTWDIDGPIGMAYLVKKGNGQVFIFGNSGPFINDMYDREDNREFVHKIISSSIADQGTVYFDITHHTSERSHHLGYSGG